MNRLLEKILINKRLAFTVSLLMVTFTMFIGQGCKNKPTDLAEAESEKTAETKTTTETEKKKTAEPAKVVIKSALAGAWYPDDSNILKEQLDSIFQKADTKPIDNVIGFILPHAGYQYSGQTAAQALNSTQKEYKRIIVIGPSHRTPIFEMLSLPKATHYETPLGQIPLDVEFINKLLEHSIFENFPSAHTSRFENGVDIELPLLQYKFQNFKLVPIMAGQCSESTIKKAASILQGMIDDDSLVVASSDFTHYGQDYGYVPFTNNIPEKLKELDMGAFKHISAIDGKGFLEYIEKTGATICGYVPIAILLDMLEKNTKSELVQYLTSGQLEADYRRSVSYFSIAFSGGWQKGSLINPEDTERKLTKEEKEMLLSLARKSIIYYLEQKMSPEPSEIGITLTETLNENQAAFVTLKKNAMLRGCIGDIFPRQPLYKSVISNAINASVKDRRFPPVKISECNDITIEISALTVPKPVNSANDIRIGIDGIVLSKDGRSAVFLPQVAPEQGWGLEETLSNLSQKAGLPADAWKQGASFLVFQADVFGEEK